MAFLVGVIGATPSLPRICAAGICALSVQLSAQARFGRDKGRP